MGLFLCFKLNGVNYEVTPDVSGLVDAIVIGAECEYLQNCGFIEEGEYEIDDFDIEE